VLKFTNFRSHVNNGRSGVNFSDTDKFYDIDNPSLVQHTSHCLILRALWLILCWNFHIFVAVETGLGLM